MYILRNIYKNQQTHFHYGGFLHFFSDDHGVSAAAVHNVLCKINAVSVKNLLEQSEKILEPVLQTWPNSTFIELLGHLLESEGTATSRFIER